MRTRLLAYGLAILTALMGLAGPAGAEVLERLTAGHWQGAAYADDAGKYARCVIGTASADKVALAFVAAPFGFGLGLTVGGWGLDPGVEFDVRVVIDGDFDASLPAKALTEASIAVVPGNEKPMIAAFRRGKSVRFDTPQGSYAVDLTGSSRALDAVLACNAERAARAGPDGPGNAVAWIDELLRQAPLSGRLVEVQGRATVVMRRIDEIVQAAVSKARGRLPSAPALEIREKIHDALSRDSARLSEQARKAPDVRRMPEREKIMELYRGYVREVGDELVKLSDDAEALFDSPPEDPSALGIAYISYKWKRQGAPVQLGRLVFEQELLAVTPGTPEHRLKMSRIETGQAFLALLDMFNNAQQPGANTEMAPFLRAAEQNANDAHAQTVPGRQALSEFRRQSGNAQPAQLAGLYEGIASNYLESFDIEDEIVDTVRDIVRRLGAPNDGSGDGPIAIESIGPLMDRQWSLQVKRLRLLKEVRALK